MKSELRLVNDASTLISSLDDPCVPLLLKNAPIASELLHSGRSFIEHLVGTWWILNKWNQPQTICRAGLLHSCYSTSFYPHALFDLSERSRVRAVIGPRAEGLAYRFCIIDRAELWSKVAPMSSLPPTLTVRRIDRDRQMSLSRQTVNNLLLIECANLAEQSAESDGSPTQWMSRLISWSQLLGRDALPLPFHLRPTLTTTAERKALQKYRLVMSAPAPALPALLDDIIRLNPWAGEPRLLRALSFLERKEKDQAFSDAMQGYSLLSAWAVSWDKRWPLSKWLSLGTAILDKLIKVDHPRSAGLTLKTVRTALARIH